MPKLPEGIITFVFTDVEGSTRLWEDAPDSMMAALNRHDEIIESVIAEHDGVSVKPRGEGDSRFLVFTDAVDAVVSIAEIQRAFSDTSWPTPRPIKVRASLLTGTAGLQLGDYYGSAVNRAARLRGIAHGGQTVLSGSTWELVRDALPDGVSVVDMGEHGLKDLTRPEHVFQMNVDGLPSEFPALKSLDAVANNLPLQLTEFVGREREVEEAKQLLAETRLLTVLAPGGTGKTRLGIQTAAELVSDFPDGVFFVGLADIDSGSEIVQTIAEALGLGLSTDEDPRQQLLSYFANKRQLLVVDNFEHVAEGATIISDILRAAPEIRVIATSRSKLSISGETVYPLSGLESSWETPDEALHAGGVRLFLDAARRASPAFELTGGDLDALSRVLAMTGGSPLGILLAAAWVDMLSVAEIADEVERSLDFLETEMGDVPDRHRSVRAVFDYSWALLSEEERTMFAALSVFKGGFTRDAAQAVAGASLRNLATLSNKSLITASPETGRYFIHELLRAYAHAELESDGDRLLGAREAHSEFYAELMDEATRLFFVADQVRMAALIEGDLDNVRSAFRHSVHTGHPRAVRFVFGIHFIYECRGWYRAGVDLLTEVADALSGAEDPDLITTRCVAVAERSWFEALLGKAGEAADAAAAAVAALPHSAAEIHRWLALQCHAICLAYVGWTDEMADLLDEAIVEYQSPSEPLWSAGLRNWRSFAAVVAEDFETVARLVPEAYAVLERVGDHYFTTWNLWLQALLAMGQGRALDAIELYERQVAVTEEISYRRGRVVALEGLGDAHDAAGQADAAIAAFAEGMAAADKMGMVRDLLGMMTKIGRVKAGASEQTEAVELLATVCAEPISAQQLFTAAVPIRDIAGEVLSELRRELGDDAYEEAHRRGAERPYEAVAKQLMDRFAG